MLNFCFAGGSSGTRDKASTSVIRPERNSDKAYNYRDEESNSDATPFEGMMMTNEHAYSSSASWGEYFIPTIHCYKKLAI